MFDKIFFIQISTNKKKKKQRPGHNLEILKSVCLSNYKNLIIKKKLSRFVV